MSILDAFDPNPESILSPAHIDLMRPFVCKEDLR